MRIAAVSDTHLPSRGGRLPRSLLARLAGADRILHAGDLVSLCVLDELSAIAPTLAVAGNMDPPEVKAALPARRLLQWEGRWIGLKHGHQPHRLQDQYIAYGYEAPAFDLFFQVMRSQLPGAQLIVFGHFHAPIVTKRGGVLFVNPGSISPPHRQPTYAEIVVGSSMTARIVALP